MTEEEMAVDWIRSQGWNEENLPSDELLQMKKAYLAGLKAGRPKWHKVADGDLPKDENDVLVYLGEDWRMCVGRYFPKYKAWETGCDTIAWCEIPKYTEE